MTEPLPCPFCGHVGVTHNEGSTFRWLVTECNGCGAQCGEERIDTLSTDQGAAIEQAAEAAIKTWNTRFTPFSPQQQAEPVAYFDFQELKFTWAKHMKIGPVPVSIKVEPMKLYSEPTKRQWDKPSASFAGLTLTEVRVPFGMTVRFEGGALIVETVHNVKEGKTPAFISCDAHGNIIRKERNSDSTP